MFALNHPEKSFPWNNTITWLLYGVYFLVTVVLLIACLLYTSPVHIVFCVNNIHIVSPSNQLIKIRNSEAFQSVHHVSFILCYTVSVSYTHLDVYKRQGSA